MVSCISVLITRLARSAVGAQAFRARAYSCQVSAIIGQLSDRLNALAESAHSFLSYSRTIVGLERLGLRGALGRG